MFLPFSSHFSSRSAAVSASIRHSLQDDCKRSRSFCDRPSSAAVFSSAARLSRNSSVARSAASAASLYRSRVSSRRRFSSSMSRVRAYSSSLRLLSAAAVSFVAASAAPAFKAASLYKRSVSFRLQSAAFFTLLHSSRVSLRAVIFSSISSSFAAMLFSSPLIAARACSNSAARRIYASCRVFSPSASDFAVAAVSLSARKRDSSSSIDAKIPCRFSSAPAIASLSRPLSETACCFISSAFAKRRSKFRISWRVSVPS